MSTAKTAKPSHPSQAGNDTVIKDPDYTFVQVNKVFTGLLLGLFVTFLSSTIVTTALPQIVKDLHGNQAEYGWVITAALLANATSTLIWGKLADLFNKKLLMQLAIIIFVVGAMCGGCAQDVSLLIFGRVLQGIGMGGAMAMNQAIMGTIVPPSQRGRYSGLIGAAVAVAQTSGPILGGFIVGSFMGWRGTFFLTVPFAIISLLILQFTLRVPTLRTGKVKIDWAGAVLLVTGISALLIWVSSAGSGPEKLFPWVSAPSMLLVVGGCVLLLAAVLVELKVSEPIIPLKILKYPTVVLVIFATIPVGVSMFSASTYLSEYFQIGLGDTPTETGLWQMPMVFGTMIGSMVSGWLISRGRSWKKFLVAGSLLHLLGLFMLAFMDHSTPHWLTCIRVAVFGLGAGMIMQNLVLAVQNRVRVRDIGASSSLITFFRMFGGAIGVSVFDTLLTNFVDSRRESVFAAHHIPMSSLDSSSGSLDLTQLPQQVALVIQHAYGDGVGRLFLVACILAVVTAVVVPFIPNQKLRSTLDLTPDEDAADKELEEPVTKDSAAA